MQKVHYAGGFLLMADPTCKALLRYARALAQAGDADVVVVPTISEGGSVATAHLLLGPSSQLFSTPVENATDEPIDLDAIASMEQLTRQLQPAVPSWEEELTDISDLGLEYEI